MSETDTPKTKLANYCLARRQEMGISQEMLSDRAGINKQTLGRIELGKTTRLSRKTKSGLARVFAITEEYLEGLIEGRSSEELNSLKICPKCWQPGAAPEPAWSDIRAKYCFLCGGGLRDACSNCGAKFTNLKHRFCPFCGTPIAS